MKLLYTKRSPYARKVQIMALEKNIDLMLVEQDLINKSDELLVANPLGKIPALILNNGEVLFDSPVICEYLEQLNNMPVLIPESKRWEILRWQAVADGLMDSAIAIYFEKVRHPNEFNQAYLTAQENACHRVLAYGEQYSEQLDELSLASIAMASALGYLVFRFPQFDTSSYPRLMAWYQVFSKRPSMQATMPSN